MTHLAVGNYLKSPDGELLVLSMLPDQGLVKVLRLTDHQETYLRYEEARHQISEGELTVVRNRKASFQDFYGASGQWKQDYAQAKRLVDAVTSKTRVKGVSACRAYAEVRKEHLNGNPSDKFPSRATVYRWLERELNQQPLLTPDSRKGNRTPRISASVASEVENYCTEYFSQPHSRWTINTITKLLNQSLREKDLIPKSRPVSNAYVRKVALRLTNNDLESRRFDPRVRKAAKSIAKNRIQAYAPLDRVEVDALHLPWLVQTPFGPSTRVHLVHAIDCATSLPVGWQLVVGSPSVADTMQCLDKVFFSKADVLSRFGCDSSLDCFGTPKSLVFDNGSENKGPRIQGVAQLGVSINFCRANHPHEKPHIERLNRSLKSALETLPGCTRFDERDGMRDPEKLGDPEIKLDELEKWIVRWYYQDWANTSLRRFERAVFTEEEHLGSTPADRFKSIKDKNLMSMPLPPNKNQWEMLRFERHQRTLSRKSGVSFEDFRFRGDELEVAIELYGETKVSILIDPLDFRAIYVPVEGTDLLMRLVNEDTNELTPALSFTQGKAVLKKQPSSVEPHPVQAVFRQDMLSRSMETTSRVNRKTSGMKKPQINKQTSTNAKNHAAIQRAQNDPIARSRTVLPSVEVAPLPESFTFSENVEAYIDQPRSKEKR